MFRSLEGKYEPLAPLRLFFGRLGRCFLVTLAIIGFSLTLGTLGYHYAEGLGWVDSLLNASMILTGMGPPDRMQTTSGKLFSVFYCLYSGLAFLSLVAILIAPIYHRFLHRFHLDESELPDLPPPVETRPLGSDL
jgi:hypothetical protein